MTCDLQAAGLPITSHWSPITGQFSLPLELRHLLLLGQVLGHVPEEVAGAAVVGCQAHKAGLVNPSFQPQDLNASLQAGDFKQKVDNFFVVLDSSGSIDETYRGYSKFAITNDFLHRMNMSIPDLDLTAR